MWPEAFSSAFGSPSGQLWGFLLTTLPTTLYFGLSESSRRQGTLGKAKAGVKVVDRNGGRLSRGRGIVRAALKFVPWELGHTCVWQSFVWRDGVAVGQELSPALVVVLGRFTRSGA